LRDPRKLIEGIFSGMLGCVFLYSLFAFFLVRSHADRIASKMILFLKYDMTPLILPNDIYLNGFLHQAGSALLLGIALGLSTALLTSAVSIVAWIRGSWGKPVDVLFTVALIPAYLYLSFCGEVPLLSLLCSISTPLFFYGPWIWTVRRGGSTRRNPFRLLLLGSLLLLPCFLIRGISLIDIRDAVVDLPVVKRVSDFYYNHTLLAAHVVKPLTHQAQKVIALSKDVGIPRYLSHGSLWIRDEDPCSIKGSSMVAGMGPMDCPGYLISDREPVNLGNRILGEGSIRLDKNRALRRGIRFFMHGSLVITIFLGACWVVFFVEDVYQRYRPIALLLWVCLLLLSASSLLHQYRIHSLKRNPEKVHEYVRSSCAGRRWISLRHFSDHLTEGELESMALDPNTKIRHLSISLLGEEGKEKFLPLMKGRMTDPELIVRTKVCWALGRIGGEEALRLLDRAIEEDPSWYVRDYAYKAREGIKPVFKAADRR